MHKNSLDAWLKQHDCTRVRAYLKIVGLAKRTGSVTIDDVVNKTDICSGAVAWRMSELKKVGVLVPFGKKLTSHNCKADCYRLSDSWDYDQFEQALDLKMTTRIPQKHIRIILDGLRIRYDKNQLRKMTSVLNQVARYKKARVQ